MVDLYIGIVTATAWTGAHLGAPVAQAPSVAASVSPAAIPPTVGTGYFDDVRTVLSHGEASTIALDESTEAEQF